MAQVDVGVQVLPKGAKVEAPYEPTDARPYGVKVLQGSITWNGNDKPRTNLAPAYVGSPIKVPTRQYALF